MDTQASNATITAPRQISLADWDARHAALRASGLVEPWYGGPLGRHVADGDFRLRHLRFDDSAAYLRLWNFLLTEEDRLHKARASGIKLIGAMKDLGTVPVIAFSASRTAAFYPDGAWWIPCVMECSESSLEIADGLGLPVTEIEVPSLSDSLAVTIRTRLEALVETELEKRHS